jgi:hypothetical protein
MMGEPKLPIPTDEPDFLEIVRHIQGDHVLHQNAPAAAETPETQDISWRLAFANFGLAISVLQAAQVAEQAGKTAEEGFLEGFNRAAALFEEAIIAIKFEHQFNPSASTEERPSVASAGPHYPQLALVLELDETPAGPAPSDDTPSLMPMPIFPNFRAA